MSFRFRAAASVLLLTAALLPGRTASAATPTTIHWRYSTCVQGALSGLQPDSNLEYFVVTGTATQCAAPAATDLPVGFGLVTYRGRAGLPGLLQGYNVRLFPAPPDTGWQPATIDFGALAVPRGAGAYGVCAVAGPTTIDPRVPVYYYAVKVACVLVTVTGQSTTGFTTTMTPLPFDDPLISGPVSQRSSYTGSTSPPPPDGSPGGDPSNFCGSCF
ncbi:hypothetical protein Aph02nite_94420 [Actinoplanes philippinensis]|uniref:Uncharacterized protein n=1 Tax=Actinoplanes philippinensis TaxID=35752 RepID=A0A1I2N8E8_9ACTN|nr:hypothetical protein [Actinoplanes philippinensis]GIE83492.1 hypothetical protein Aph02nite_94420 [Actinoplanes philippinensis]SFF99843.1 hypothetical protein SAMN05421541_14024 [Actinoplanes philippinensis]